MADGTTDVGEGYSSLMGLMYVFNLIVGTGALAMPAPIAEAGWLLSLIILIFLAFMSFVTVTFVTESMAAANAIVHSRTVRHLKKVMKTEEEGNQESSQQLVERFLTDEVISNSLENEKVPLLLSNSVETISETNAEYFNITERIEMGKMALLFFNRLGVNIFYICIAVYLYGDLAIYAAAVSKSLRDVSCTHVPSDAFCNDTLNETVPCWDSSTVTRGDSYRIFLTTFLVLLGPFTFFNVQKTKYLQIFTTFMRWLGSKTDCDSLPLVHIKNAWPPIGQHMPRPSECELVGIHIPLCISDVLIVQIRIIRNEFPTGIHFDRNLILLGSW